MMIYVIYVLTQVVMRLFTYYSVSQSISKVHLSPSLVESFSISMPHGSSLDPKHRFWGILV